MMLATKECPYEVFLLGVTRDTVRTWIMLVGEGDRRSRLKIACGRLSNRRFSVGVGSLKAVSSLVCFQCRWNVGILTVSSYVQHITHSANHRLRRWHIGCWQLDEGTFSVPVIQYPTALIASVACALLARSTCSR